VRTQIDQARLERFVGQAIGDMAAAISGLLLHIVDRRDLYQAMAGPGRSRRKRWPSAPQRRRGSYKKWLSNQAASAPADPSSQHSSTTPPTWSVTRRQKLSAWRAPTRQDKA
jgi:hypothetical protein